MVRATLMEDIFRMLGLEAGKVSISYDSANDSLSVYGELRAVGANKRSGNTALVAVMLDASGNILFSQKMGYYGDIWTVGYTVFKLTLNYASHYFVPDKLSEVRIFLCVESVDED